MASLHALVSCSPLVSVDSTHQPCWSQDLHPQCCCPPFFFLFSCRSLLLLSVAMSVRWPVVESLVCACAVRCSCGACVGCSGVSCLAGCTRQLQVSCTRTGSTMHAGHGSAVLAAPAQHTCRGAARGSRALSGMASSAQRRGSGFVLQQFDCFTVCVCLSLALSLSLFDLRVAHPGRLSGGM